MCKFFFLALFLWIFQPAQAQLFSIKKLISLTSLNAAKFESYVSKERYILKETQPGYIKYSYQGKRKGKHIDTAEKYIVKYLQNREGTIGIQKVTKEEYKDLTQEIKELDFSEGKINNRDSLDIFQKENFTIYTIADTTGNISGVYEVIIERKVLPGPMDINYAEDLLPINSHEQLVSVFGSRNVVKDEFTNRGNKKRNCSVLFPNSYKEAVFLWKDEKNYRNIMAIRIGGSTQTEGSKSYDRPVEINSWKSKQGIYPGMSLKELDEKNGNAVNFYGWDNEGGGILASNNSGTIDFKKVSLILSCFNCNEPQYYSTKMNSSKKALEEDKKIHVATMIILL